MFMLMPLPLRYYWCFTYAWVASLVAATIFGLFGVAVTFRYKGGPKEESDEFAPDFISDDAYETSDTKKESPV